MPEKNYSLDYVLSYTNVCCTGISNICADELWPKLRARKLETCDACVQMYDTT